MLVLISVLAGLVAVLVLLRLTELGADRIVERRFTRERQARSVAQDVRRMAAEVNHQWARELTVAVRDR